MLEKAVKVVGEKNVMINELNLLIIELIRKNSFHLCHKYFSIFFPYTLKPFFASPLSRWRKKHDSLEFVYVERERDEEKGEFSWKSYFGVPCQEVMICGIDGKAKEVNVNIYKVWRAGSKIKYTIGMWRYGNIKVPSRLSQALFEAAINHNASLMNNTFSIITAVFIMNGHLWSIFRLCAPLVSITLSVAMSHFYNMLGQWKFLTHKRPPFLDITNYDDDAKLFWWIEWASAWALWIFILDINVTLLMNW